MNQIERISMLTQQALKQNNFTICECCNSFNLKYKNEIFAGKIKALNKDFVSRVSRGKFKIANKRVLKLCEFLEINFNENESFHFALLSKQIEEFETCALNDKKFRQRFSAVRKLLRALDPKEIFGGGIV